MVEIELCKALRGFLAVAVKDLRLPVDIDADNPEPEMRVPLIVNGFLPNKRRDDISDFPFVIVRPTNGKTESNSETKVSVTIVVGTYSWDERDYQDCLLVMQRIRMALLTMPGYVLAKKYRLEFPFEWNLYDEQPAPSWQMSINTEWTIATPQLPLGEEFYG